MIVLEVFGDWILKQPTVAVVEAIKESPIIPVGKKQLALREWADATNNTVGGDDYEAVRGN